MEGLTQGLPLDDLAILAHQELAEVPPADGKDH